MVNEVLNKIYQKSTLDAVDVAEQVLVADSPIEFGLNNVLTGCSIKHTEGSPNIKLEKAGLYYVSFSADVAPTASGITNVYLTKNDVLVKGAEATFLGVASVVNNIHFDGIIEVYPSCPAIDNNVNLQVILDVAGTVSNANMVVIKVA